MASYTISKRSNPNLEEIYVDPNQLNDDYEDDEDDNDLVQMNPLPGYEFDNVAASRKKVRDDIVNESTSNLPPLFGVAPPPPRASPVASPTTYPEASPAAFGNGSGNGVVGTGVPVVPIGQGVFIYDFEKDEPHTTFTFATLTNALATKARLYHDPVLMFLASVAKGCGSTLDNMLIDPHLPLVNKKATNVPELVEGSKIPQDLLVKLLTELLSVILNGKTAQPKVVEKDDPMTPLKPNKNKNNNNNNASSPPMVFKEEKKEFASGDAENIVNQLIMHRAALVGHCATSQQQQQPALIGVDIVGGGPQGQGQDDRGPDLTQQLIQLFYRQIVDTDAEIVKGLAIVRPEAIAAIDGAYQDIRQISSSHNTFKLWHLMTSAAVRNSFAAMIAGVLNASPGEIQYPHYTKNVRGTNLVTGARVSSGFHSQIRGTSAYKEKRRWFATVHYGTATAWTDAINKLPEAVQSVTLNRQLLSGDLKELKRLLVESPSSIWKRMGNDQHDYKRLLVELDQLQREYDEKKKLYNYQVSRFQSMSKHQTLPDLLAAQEDNVMHAQNVMDAKERERDLKISEIRNNQANTNAWTESFAMDGVVLVAFAPYIGRDIMRNVDRLDMELFIPLLETKTIPRLLAVLKRTEMWNGHDIDDVRTTVQQVLASAYAVLRDYKSVQMDSKQIEQHLKVQNSFTEDEKRELFKGSAEVRPLHNYLEPASIYATI